MIVHYQPPTHVWGYDKGVLCASMYFMELVLKTLLMLMPLTSWLVSKQKGLISNKLYECLNYSVEHMGFCFAKMTPRPCNKQAL